MSGWRDSFARFTAQSVQLVVTTLQADFAAFGTPGRRYSDRWRRGQPP